MNTPIHTTDYSGEDRRIADMRLEGAYGLAILYTLGYLTMVGALMFFDIPQNNRELLISLVGIMSAAQLAIVKYYYDGSQASKQAQQVSGMRAARSDAVIQDLAKSAPATTAAAVAASVAGTPIVIQPPVSPSTPPPPTNGDHKS